MEKLSLINKAIQRLKDVLGEGFIAAALFGSVARGEVQRSGDIDLFVIIESLPKNPYERQVFIRSILPIECSSISIFAKTKEEFEDRFLSIYLDIGADGIILFDRGDYLKKRLDKVRDIIKREDLIRRRMGKELLWCFKVPKRGRVWEINWA